MTRWKPAMIVAFGLAISELARADIFGGDDILLVELVANTASQLAQLRQLLSAGKDTLGLLEDVNRGLSDALQLSKNLRGSLDPGVLSNLRGVSETMAAVEKLYGLVPSGPDASAQKTADQSVAEAIDLHNQIFPYAEEADAEADRIKNHAQLVSPQGAGKLTAESLGVVINVMNQLLRTNAAMLKLQGEQLASENRRAKLGTEQFKAEYQGLAQAFDRLKPEYDLPSVTSR